MKWGQLGVILLNAFKYRIWTWQLFFGARMGLKLDYNQLFNKNSWIFQKISRKIWIKLKKCIPLHPLSGTKYWSEKKEFFEEDYIKDREVVQWARFSLSRMRGARGKRTVRFARMWCQVLFEPRIRRSWTEQTMPFASVSSWTEAGAVRYYTM